MSTDILYPHRHWLPGFMVCIFLSQTCTSPAHDANADLAQKIWFGRVHHTHDTSPSLLIEPRAHLRAVVGSTDLEDSGLAQGAHDPAYSGFSLPALSLGMDIRYGEHIAGFAEGIVSWSNEDQWDIELEELYAQFINLPGGFEIKAGQLLAAVGTQNNIHNHGWKFVDADMGNVRFLGEDGLIIEGVELVWLTPTQWDDRLVVSYGNAAEHAHDEGHEGEEDEHHDDEEAEETLWDYNVFSARYQASFWPRDTCRFVYGASYVVGKNYMGKTARLYGLDLTYTWLEDEDHGKQVIWRNEAMLRKVDTDEGSFDEFTFTSAAHYRINPKWEIGLRYNYLEGVEDPELPERHRVSPILSHYFTVAGIKAIARLQYNYDHSQQRGDDHSIWLQFGFDWGAGGDVHVH